MKTQLGSYSTKKRAVLFLFIIAIVAASAVAQTRTFTVKNNCSETVWVAGSGSTVPVFNGTSSGGIELLPGAPATTTVPFQSSSTTPAQTTVLIPHARWISAAFAQETSGPWIQRETW